MSERHRRRIIPIRDNIPSRTTPFVNYLVIAATTLAFIGQLTREPDEPSPVERYGMIPARVMEPDRPVQVPDVQIVRGRPQRIERPAAEAAVPPWLTLFTCIFLHGGWLHFLSNMWFLHIFGDNVEDRFGHLGYLVFYVVCGTAASAAHLAADPASNVPTIGASGAIAGVMGAYFLFYPRAKVLAVVPIVFFFYVMVLPASLFLGIWFVIQFLQGAVAVVGAAATGVAWWAHVGGFVAGLAIAWTMEKAHALGPKMHETPPDRPEQQF